MTNSKSQILSRASEGYRLEQTQPQLLVLVSASSDCALAAEASPDRAVMASPGVGVPSAVLGAIGVGGFTRDNSRRRLSKKIEWLKQAGEGARGVFKGRVE